jgi:hypothetical protein
VLAASASILYGLCVVLTGFPHCCDLWSNRQPLSFSSVVSLLAGFSKLAVVLFPQFL